MDCDVVRVRTDAGLALIRTGDRTRWVSWPPAPVTVSAQGPPSLELRAQDLPPGLQYSLVPSADGHPPQNVLVLLHGRGDGPAPFARFASQMALPQTAAIALRAPEDLPFDLGPTWVQDLDDQFEVIPSDRLHAGRSRSLVAAADVVKAFLTALHVKYNWPHERLFLFGFSQGACVAYQAATTFGHRLGGLVLVAGGFVSGRHNQDKQMLQGGGGGDQTPALLLTGSIDEVYPSALAKRTVQHYSSQAPSALITLHESRKPHGMISSREEMQQVMQFFAAHLYLRNFALEARSDIIELH